MFQVIALSAVALFVPAHMWYSTACCSARDCAPVAEGVVVGRPDGVHVQGHGILKYGDPRLLRSLDGSDHVCEIKPPHGPGLRCIYLKSLGM